MNCAKFTYDKRDYLITHTRKTYQKSKIRKVWKTVPTKMEIELYRPEQYQRFVRSVPFFDGFLGGTCTAKCRDTVAGHLPVEIISISPDKNIKHEDTFQFVHFPTKRALWEGEFRERDIMDNLERYEILYQGDSKIFKFYHKDGEHTAMFNVNSFRWVG